MFQGQDLVTMSEQELAALRWRDFSVVMQSAMNALNPVKSIGAQFRDAIMAHDEPVADERPAEVLRLVGIDPIHLNSYPHQLSGGMRQRAMIAMALLFTPDLIIMDEPTSALDVVAQRSLMVQIKELQRQLGFAVIFVTHDMSLVSHFSDRLLVMYAGQVGRVRRHPRGVRSSGASVQRRAAGRVSVDPRSEGAADGYPRQSAEPGRSAAGLPVPAALPEGVRGLPEDRAGALPGGRRAGALPAPCHGTGPGAHIMTSVDVNEASVETAGAPLLEAKDLTRHFRVGRGFSRQMLHAVDEVELLDRAAGDRRAGRRERQRQEHDRAAAGAGLQADERRDLLPGQGDCRRTRSRKDQLSYRGDVPMVFQDPFSSLNPAYRVSHGITAWR